MSIAYVWFLVLVFTTFFNNAIQWYTHFESYPLQAWVGPAEFNEYGAEYERRLIVALYIPYFIMLFSNIALIFVHPTSLSLLPILACFVLNLSIAIISFMLAVPLHKKHAQVGYVSKCDLPELLRVNALRLGAASLSSLFVIGMLVSLINFS